MTRSLSPIRQRSTVGLYAFALVILFLSLAVQSWRRSGDPFVDWGRELYMAWRVADGAVLGQDVVTLFGPISVQFNAWLFELGGRSMTPILLANLGIAALAAIVVCYCATLVFRRSTAALLTAVFLVAFAFPQFGPYGSYSFVAPYSHAATHGLLLALLSLAFSMAAVRFSSSKSLVLASLAGGSTWLFKPEFAFASGITLALTVAVCWSLRPRRRLLGAGLALFLPASVFTLAWSRHSGLESAIAALIAPFWNLLTVPAAAPGFYGSVLGLDDLPGNIAITAASALFVVSLAAGWLMLDRGASRLHSFVGVGTAGLVFVFIAAAFSWHSHWMLLGRALPILLAGGLAWLAVNLLPSRTAGRDPEVLRRRAGLLIWSVFALALLAKVILHVRIRHYGFVLAGPGLILILGILIDDVPRIAVRNWRDGTISRFGAYGLASAVFLSSLHTSIHSYRSRDGTLGAGGDLMYVFGESVDPRPPVFRRALELVRDETRPVDGVAVIPEGGILNYLARRRTPVPTATVLPPEIAVLTVDRLLSDFRTRPPALILVSRTPLPDYAGRAAGDDPGFGREILEWVELNYDREARFSEESSSGWRFEMEAFRRTGSQRP